MTGWDDINSLKDQLQAHPLLGDPTKVLLLACHGSMDSSEQVITRIYIIFLGSKSVNLYILKNHCLTR